MFLLNWGLRADWEFRSVTALSVSILGNGTRISIAGKSVEYFTKLDRCDYQRRQLRWTPISPRCFQRDAVWTTTRWMRTRATAGKNSFFPQWQQLIRELLRNVLAKFFLFSTEIISLKFLRRNFISFCLSFCSLCGFFWKANEKHSLDYFHCLSHSHCPLISKAKKRAKKRKAICKVHWDELFAHGELDWWWTLRVDCRTAKRVCRFDEARFAKVNWTFSSEIGN